MRSCEISRLLTNRNFKLNEYKYNYHISSLHMTYKDNQVSLSTLHYAVTDLARARSHDSEPVGVQASCEQELRPVYFK